MTSYLSIWYLIYLAYAHASLASRVHVSIWCLKICLLWLCRRFDPRGSLDRRVNCRRVPQPRWVGARRSAKGGKLEGDRRKRGNPRPSCLSRAQVGCACSRGLQASVWEGARGLHAPSRPPRAANPRKRALDLPFIGVRRGSRCTMGDVAVC
jgi:hypothetical protein